MIHFLKSVSISFFAKEVSVSVKNRVCGVDGVGGTVGVSVTGGVGGTVGLRGVVIEDHPVHVPPPPPPDGAATITVVPKSPKSEKAEVSQVTVFIVVSTEQFERLFQSEPS